MSGDMADAGASKKGVVKRCSVKTCNSTSLNKPNKRFLAVPTNPPERRLAWLQAIDKNPSSVTARARLYVCENHFDFANDVENYTKFKLYPGSRVFLKAGVVPHIFRPPNQESEDESSDSTDSTVTAAPDDEPGLSSETLSADSPRHSDEDTDCGNVLETVSVDVEDDSDNSAADDALVISVDKGDDSLAQEVERAPSSVTSTSREAAEALCLLSTSASIASEPPPLCAIVCDKETQTLRVQMEHKSVAAKPYVRSKFVQCSIISPKDTQDAQTSPACEYFNTHKSPVSAKGEGVKKVTFSTPEAVAQASSITTPGSSDISTPQSMGLSQSSGDYKPHSSSAEEGEDLGFDRLLQIRSINTKLSLEDSMYFLGVPPSSLSLITTLGECIKVDPLHILICLKKIRLNQTFKGLGYDFGVSESYATKIFKNVVPKLAQCLSTLIVWPSKDKIKERLPISFRARYSIVQSIIDCFEIEVEKPSDPVLQTLTWSSYKHANTLKFFISGTPDGLINFVSKGFGGRTSDVKITEQCGFLDVLPAGAGVMADRGFKGLAKHLEAVKCVLLRPPSVAAGQMSTKEEVRETKRIASLRIHIERIIRRVREFNMLKPHACVHHSLIKYLDNVVEIVCGLINLQEPLIKKFV